MKIGEIIKVYNAEESGIFGLEEMLYESKRFVYEDEADVIIYKNFINNELLYTIKYDNLIAGEIYYPIQYSGAPFQKTIKIEYPKKEVRFTKIKNNLLYFIDKKQQEYSYVQERNTMITLIYKTKNDFEQSILNMKLRFNGWDIRVKAE